MKVRTLRDSYKGCPPEFRAAGDFDQSILHIHVGAEYEVYGVTVFSGVVCLCIIDDLEYFSWYNAWLFEVIDPQMPADWIACPYNYNPCLVIGPKLIAGSMDSYESFVDEEPDMVHAMRALIEGKNKQDEE